MVGVVSPVWNLHFNIPMPVIGVLFPITPKVLGSVRGVMGPTKNILCGDMDRLSPLSNIMVSRSVLIRVVSSKVGWWLVICALG